jgi:hypothetical protein
VHKKTVRQQLAFVKTELNFFDQKPCVVHRVGLIDEFSLCKVVVNVGVVHTNRLVLILIMIIGQSRKLVGNQTDTGTQIKGK